VWCGTSRANTASCTARSSPPAVHRHGQRIAASCGTRPNAPRISRRRESATTGRDIILALPHELSHAQRIAAVQEFAAGLVERYGVAVDFAIHAPDRHSNERNYHAHVLMTTRQIGANGFGAKTGQYDRPWAARSKARGIGSAKARQADPKRPRRLPTDHAANLRAAPHRRRSPRESRPGRGFRHGAVQRSAPPGSAQSRGEPRRRAAVRAPRRPTDRSRRRFAETVLGRGRTPAARRSRAGCHDAWS
jgi:hypothetical protein